MTPAERMRNGSKMLLPHLQCGLIAVRRFGEDHLFGHAQREVADRATKAHERWPVTALARPVQAQEKLDHH
jgi:hypothetical protein